MADSIPSGTSMKDLPVQQQAKINAACSSFFLIGFPSELFTISNLNAHCFSVDKFLEFIQPYSSITDLKILSYLFKKASRSVVYDLVDDPNKFCEFTNCVNWLKTDSLEQEKKKQITKSDSALARMIIDSVASVIQERNRIQRAIVEITKRQDELIESASAFAASSFKSEVVEDLKKLIESTSIISVDDSASVYSLKSKVVDELKKVIESVSISAVDHSPSSSSASSVTSEVDELKRRQQQLETEYASIVAVLKEKLGPFYDYEEPSEILLEKECCVLWEKEMKSHGISSKPTVNKEQAEELVHIFGATAKDLHLSTYMNDPVRKELIEPFIKEFVPGW